VLSINRYMSFLRENAPRNRVEHASWNEDEAEEVVMDNSIVPGKYRSTVSNILSKHCTEVKLISEEMIQTASHLSKKKLKDLITKQNDELFSFMAYPDKIPPVMGLAETIFRRYGREVPSIKIQPTASITSELNVNMEMDPVIEEFKEGLSSLHNENGLGDFVTKMRWLTGQYKSIGEEVLRLETNLFQKIDLLDKVHNRIPTITSLSHNDALPELVDSFYKYIESVYQNSQFDETYHELIQAYKKWNICRQLLSVPHMMRQDANEPCCSICLLESVSYTIVPCGHTFCSGCSKKQNTTCFICRGTIRERLKLYFT
jgi:Zinc finger, C3HC4 type (RING finger)